VLRRPLPRPAARRRRRPADGRYPAAGEAEAGPHRLRPAQPDHGDRRLPAAADDRRRRLRPAALDGRPDRPGAGAADARALGHVLVRHRHAGAGRLFPRALWRADLADRRLLGRLLRLGDRADDRPRLRLCALGGQHHHADHGRDDVDPLHPARHRPDGPHPGQRAERHHRHHHRRDPARLAPGARRGALAARAALCRCRGRGGDADAAHHPPPHPAEHPRAHHRAGHLCLRRGDDHGGDPLLHRRRDAADHPVLGQHHGRGPGALAGEALYRLLPRPLPLHHRSRGQPAGRWPARCARPAHGKEGL
ncbi:MAG: ABC transporter, permease protein 2 (cluster 5, nickel/peptides/opines), partial [uncultured Craurococcus sp.]